MTTVQAPPSIDADPFGHGGPRKDPLPLHARIRNVVPSRRSGRVCVEYLAYLGDVSVRL